MALSGISSSTPSKPQNEGGNQDHTLRFEPKGGNESGGPSSGRMKNRGTEFALSSYKTVFLGLLGNMSQSG
jgi:hypothetical protein